MHELMLTRVLATSSAQVIVNLSPTHVRGRRRFRRAGWSGNPVIAILRRLPFLTVLINPRIALTVR